MEGGKSCAGEASSSKPASVCYSYGGRLVFDIELTPGETTIVSWKKLLRDANRAKLPVSVAASSSSLPVVSAQPIPVAMDQVTKSKPEDEPPSNRFSAVVEKIERLYVGKQSSDEEELDDVPDDDQYDTEDSFIDDAELDEYFQVDKATTKHNGFFVNKGKLEHIDDEPTLSADHQQKKQRKKRVKSIEEDKGDDHGPNKHSKLGHARMKVAARTAPLAVNSGDLSTRDNPEFPLKADNGTILKTGITQSNVTDGMFPDCQEKNATELFQIPAKRLLGDNDEREFATKKRKDKNGSDKLPDLNLPVSNDSVQQPIENATVHLKDVSSVRPKGTMLERAIRDLEKVVAESRPQKMEALQDADTSSMATKRRLPREVKQKLAKVARLAQSSQGRISEELTNHLMSIVGHLVQLRTLKRNLREMVLLGLSAKREKADRFQQIKTEVLEMIKVQGHSKSTVELGLEEKRGLNGKDDIDNAIEDRICDLYDLYVQGMDEDKGPQMRKLYIELAELWPNGSMDNTGIKSAVGRAKERRKALHNHEQVEGKAGRKNLPATKTDIVRGGEADSTGQSPARAADEPLPLISSHHDDLPREEKLENLTFPMLKEQMKQQNREIEKRAKKLTLKPEKGAQKAGNGSNSQVPSLPPPGR